MTQHPRSTAPFAGSASRRWTAAVWFVFGFCPQVIAAVGDTGAVRFAALGALGVTTLTYAAAEAFPGHPAVPPRTVLRVLVIGLGALAFLRDGGAALFAVTLPLFWLYADGARAAVAHSGAAAALTVAADAARDHGGDGGLLTYDTAFTLLFYAVSVLMGTGWHRMSEHSDERARRLSAELESAQQRLAEAHQKQGAADERERIAREIHDTLAQGFASIVVLAEAARAGLETAPDRSAQQLLSIERTARENLAEARILVGAASQAPAPGSISQALRRVLDRFAEDTGIAVGAELPDVECDRQTGIALLRCAQESLANVRKHAEASAVDVVLTPYSYGVELEITDDGKGFVVAGSRGFGLNGMSKRLAELGGELTVTSSVGDGTRILAMIPTNGQV
ncbi:sensor histidine kinase [Streptomyces sp. NPDC050504]|uniref:sensor histidine kinase n=1 Tax=Streptomyces sp. NPDC050504 TaxID=3365618 RepID=UPI003787EC03